MGEVVVNSLLETNIAGVFAAGDSIQKKYRQVTTAVADGTVAALNAIEYLRKFDLQAHAVGEESVLTVE